MLEFTGERVIPGLADASLFNEHQARYRFATRFLARFDGCPAVLDAGCGTGYGSAEFPATASVAAMDLSADAVRYAREHFGAPHIQFLQAACETLPFADNSFDLITAFEVIEHLERWPRLLTEARRVLKAGGILLVSTPNKSAYAESRAAAGPNPFHVREFEYQEFHVALTDVFPHVSLWSQNHAEAIAFLPSVSSAGALDATPDQTPESAHFFLAACSLSPLPPCAAFAYLPKSGNILREREHHIALLRGELEQKTGWLNDLEKNHTDLVQKHDDVVTELEEHNRWADQLNGALAKARACIAGLQDELTTNQALYRDHAAALEQEAGLRLGWIQSLESQIEGGRAQIERLGSEIGEFSIAFDQRTAWGESLAAELLRKRQELETKTEELHQTQLNLQNANAELTSIAHSKWIGLGGILGIGPKVSDR